MDLGTSNRLQYINTHVPLALDCKRDKRNVINLPVVKLNTFLKWNNDSSRTQFGISIPLTGIVYNVFSKDMGQSVAQSKP